MITGTQIREARRLTKMPAFELARRCHVASVTIARAEKADGQPKLHDGTLTRIRAALEAAGVEFTDGEQPGARMRGGEP